MEKQEENSYQSIIQRNTGNSDLATRKYFDSLLIEMRIIDSQLADPSMVLFGQKFATPVMFGVIGGYDHLGEHAAMNSALGCKAADTPLWVSEHLSDEETADMIAAGVKVIRVVKPFQDTDLMIRRLKKAEELGCFAVASDIDHAYNKNGELDGHQPGQQFGPKTSADLKRIVSALHIPFIAKGVLSVSDAVKCRDAGVSAILLSHHHSIMDSAVPPLAILPDVRKAVGKEYPIIVDCGIVSGADAFKALALGANAVCVARTLMKPLHDGGAAGVSDAIKGLTGQLRGFMDRTSSADLAHIDPSVIHRLSL